MYYCRKVHKNDFIFTTVVAIIFRYIFQVEETLCRNQVFEDYTEFL